jgi:hypothetical protein
VLSAAAAAGGLAACKKNLLATGGRFYKQPHPSKAAADGTRHLQLPQQMTLATGLQQQHLAALLLRHSMAARRLPTVIAAIPLVDQYCAGIAEFQLLQLPSDTPPLAPTPSYSPWSSQQRDSSRAYRVDKRGRSHATGSDSSVPVACSTHMRLDISAILCHILSQVRQASRQALSPSMQPPHAVSEFAQISNHHTCCKRLCNKAARVRGWVDSCSEVQSKSLI